MAASTSSASSTPEPRSILSSQTTPSKGSNSLSGSALPAGATSKLFVSNVRVGLEDARGVVIDQVYAIRAARYAVYRARDRMMVHFADDAATASEQRKRLD